MFWVSLLLYASERFLAILSPVTVLLKTTITTVSFFMIYLFGSFFQGTLPTKLLQPGDPVLSRLIVSL